MLIAVAGNIGSGKTTLAKFIAANYDFSYVPNHRFEFDFIDSFFEDISGMFLPAQLSFLMSKAIEIQQLTEQRKNVVVDRSVIEDIHVFARLWIENKEIDEKIVELYRYTSEFIRQSLPSPDLYIHCVCPAEVSQRRIAGRARRSFEEKYPPGHVQMLEKYYSELEFEEGVPYVRIDTERYDFTKAGTLKAVCAMIFDRFAASSDYGQFSLFDAADPGDSGTEGMTFRGFDTAPTVRHKRIEEVRKYIYLAAPFTQFATQDSRQSRRENTELSLFFGQNDTAAYGEIPRDYRRKLTNNEKALTRACGVPVLLPHRDINNWGKTTFPAEHLVPEIVKSIEGASAVVAVPGSSIGVHLEVGMAIERRLPIVLFDAADVAKSFFMDGLANLPNVKCIRVPSIDAIPGYIEAGNIAGFLKINERRMLHGEND